MEALASPFDETMSTIVLRNNGLRHINLMKTRIHRVNDPTSSKDMGSEAKASKEAHKLVLEKEKKGCQHCAITCCRQSAITAPSLHRHCAISAIAVSSLRRHTAVSLHQARLFQVFEILIY